MEHLEPRNRSKRGFYLVLVVVLVIALGMGVYFALTSSGEDQAPDTAESTPEDPVVSAVTESVLSGVAPAENPLADVPSVNPVEQANPFSNIKTNPF